MKLTKLPEQGRSKATGDELAKLRERVHRLETNDAERFVGEEPVDAVALYRGLLEDYENERPKYYEKRIRICGIVSKIGPDEFGAPSFEFTDAENTRCYELIVSQTKEIYEKVKEGDMAEIIGNVVFIREPYGLVVKKCVLLGKAEES